MTDQTILNALTALEAAVLQLPEDVSAEITVDLKIHDDAPNLYVETTGGTGYQKVLGTRNGMVTKSITITFPN